MFKCTKKKIDSAFSQIKYDMSNIPQTAKHLEMRHALQSKQKYHLRCAVYEKMFRILYTSNTHMYGLDDEC